MRPSLLWLMIGIIALSAVALGEELPPRLAETQARCDRFLQSLKDLTMVQEMTMAEAGDTLISRQTIYRKGDDSRTDMEMFGPGGIPAGMPSVVIHFGGTNTLVTPMGSRELTAEEAAEYEPERICWDFTNHDAQIVGSEIVDGHDCDVIEMFESDQRYRLLVDKERYLVLGGSVHTTEGDTLRWAFSDFRAAAYDFEFPHRIEMYSGSQLVSLLKVESVAVNTGFSDELFDPTKVTMPSADELLEQLLGGEDKK